MGWLDHHFGRPASIERPGLATLIFRCGRSYKHRTPCVLVTDLRLTIELPAVIDARAPAKSIKLDKKKLFGEAANQQPYKMYSLYFLQYLNLNFTQTNTMI